MSAHGTSRPGTDHLATSPVEGDPAGCRVVEIVLHMFAHRGRRWQLALVLLGGHLFDGALDDLFAKPRSHRRKNVVGDTKRGRIPRENVPMAA